MLNDFSFSFSIRSLRIAYLTPADNTAPAKLVGMTRHNIRRSSAL